jgi:hypothetical protein
VCRQEFVRVDLEDVAATLPTKEPLACEFGERKADSLASRSDHVCKQLVCQREIDADTTWNDVAICPSELEKLLAHTFGVTDVGAVADGRVTLAKRLSERIGDELSRRGKPEQNLQGVGRDNRNLTRGEGLEALAGRRRNKQCFGLTGCQDDPTTLGAVVVAFAAPVADVCADQEKAFLDAKQGRIGYRCRAPHCPSLQRDRRGSRRESRGHLAADLAQPSK